MENAAPLVPSKATPSSPSASEVAHYQEAGRSVAPQSMNIVKHLSREVATGVIVALVVGGGTWASSGILPETLNYGCPAATDAGLARGYQDLVRKDTAHAQREAEDIAIVQPNCAKAHALWSAAAAAAMGTGTGTSDDDDNRRVARREAAIAERLGYRSDTIEAILAVTGVS